MYLFVFQTQLLFAFSTFRNQTYQTMVLYVSHVLIYSIYLSIWWSQTCAFYQLHSNGGWISSIRFQTALLLTSSHSCFLPVLLNDVCHPHRLHTVEWKDDCGRWIVEGEKAITWPDFIYSIQVYLPGRAMVNHKHLTEGSRFPGLISKSVLHRTRRMRVM